MEIIYLNVGGVKYTTTLETLKQVPNGLLCRMVTGNISTTKIGKRIFIDRNGKLFEHILDYLRQATTWNPSEHVDKIALLREADFFLLDSLKKLLTDPYEEFKRKYPVIQMKISKDRNDKFCLKFYTSGIVEESKLQIGYDESHKETIIIKMHNMKILSEMGYYLKAVANTENSVTSYYFEAK